MKKILSGIVLALGLVGVANADTNYACEFYSGKINGESHMMVGGMSNYNHLPSGELRKFKNIKVAVHDNNTFSIHDVIEDKVIKSPKLKDLSTNDLKAYGLPDKSISYAYGEDGNPIFRYMKENSYTVMGCAKID